MNNVSNSTFKISTSCPVDGGYIHIRSLIEGALQGARVDHIRALIDGALSGAKNEGEFVFTSISEMAK